MAQPSSYFDHAATSYPKPPEMREALLHYYDQVAASAGRGAYAEAAEAGRILDELRSELAVLIGAANPDRIIFTLNCTDALNLGLKGVLREGDHVITTWMDHNSILRPLHHMEEAGMVSVTRVKADATGYVAPEAIAEAMTDRTRLVATLHASNVSGTLQSVAEIGALCKARGVLFLLDGAQTVGAVPLDVQSMNIDLLAFPGHKALMGPLGTGALWIAEHLDLKTLREGGTGSKSEAAIQPTFLPDRYEPGSHNLLGLAGLLAAVKFVHKVGVDSIFAHEQELSERFLAGLRQIDGLKVHGPLLASKRTPVFSVTMPGHEAIATGERLDREFGLKVRSGLHCAPLAHQTLGTFECGTIRLSAGFFTGPEDIDRALSALSQIASRERGLEHSASQ